MRTREFVAVILGFLGLFTMAFAAQTVAYLLLSPERVFQGESYEISEIWIAVVLVTGLVGAIFGGYLSRFIAGSAKPAYYFAGLIVLVEFAFGSYGLLYPLASELQEGDVKMLNAMNLLISPKWLMFVHGCVTSVGVLTGAHITKKLVRASTKEKGQVLETGI